MTNETVVEVADLRAFYGQVEALHGVDIRVGTGEIVVVLGANGAGKTTLLRALTGMVRTTGDITLAGRAMAGKDVSAIVRMGVAHVPQGRGTLTELSVTDNLLAGAYTRRDKEIQSDIDHWFNTFPRLAERRDNLAGGLSGGEQQMLAVARALMSRPELLLLDEPSLGLAPVIVELLFDVLAAVNTDRSVAMVVVEQNAALALDLAQRGYVLEAGTVAAEGTSDELRSSDSIKRAYLGY